MRKKYSSNSWKLCLFPKAIDVRIQRSRIHCNKKRLLVLEISIFTVFAFAQYMTFLTWCKKTPSLYSQQKPSRPPLRNINFNHKPFQQQKWGTDKKETSVCTCKIDSRNKQTTTIGDIQNNNINKAKKGCCSVFTIRLLKII